MWERMMRQLMAVAVMLGIMTAGASGAMAQVYSNITSHDVWLNTERPLTPEDLEGRVILLDFWTFCCINCIHIIPELQKLEKKFGDKLTVIGVHSAKFKNERDTKAIRDAVLRYGIHHPVVNDHDFKIWQSFGVNSWPTLMLLAPNGQVQRRYSGEGHMDAIEDEIQILLNQYEDEVVTSPLPIALEADKEPETVVRFPGKVQPVANLLGLDHALVVSDSGHHRLVVMKEDGQIVAEIGNGREGLVDGSFEDAQFNTPQGVAYDGKRYLYVADTDNHALRRVDMQTRTVETIAGTGERGFDRVLNNATAKGQELASPWDVAFYPDQDNLAIAMAGTHQLWSLNIPDQKLSILAGSGREDVIDGRYPFQALAQTSGMDVEGDRLYFLDSETSALRYLEGEELKTLVGTGLFDFGLKDGEAFEALLQHPLGLDVVGDTIYIADSYNHAIRTFDLKKKALSTLIGNGESGMQDGTFTAARFSEPADISCHGGKCYVADTNNQRIRVVDLDAGMVSTLPVMPPKTPIAYEEALPNLQSLQAVTIAASKPLSLQLQLADGWKINADAPSYLALFEKGGADAVGQLEVDALKASTTPSMDGALEAGKSYVLQGTLYYCEKEEGSLCLIKSVQLPVKATADAAAKTVMIPVN